MLVSCYLFIIQGSLHITVYVSVCFHAIFMSPLWLNHPGLPILVSANEAHGTLADLHSIFLTMHNAVKFYHFFHCTVENLRQCSAVETPGTEGIIFSSGGEEKERRGEEERTDGGGRITFSSARGKNEADYFQENNLR